MTATRSRRHLADPVHLLGDGTAAQCSCGRRVERLLKPVADGRDPHTAGDYRWRHVWTPKGWQP